ncbi:MAG: N-acetyl-gamma-glutamyl-phosphate reductase [Alphaproteobacteria bacterium]|nr:N-acetyl-gamma-glutamyl-phosphate reductase [Alphaproteobacteria bacterium]
MTATVFIDGEAGTTGLQIKSRLEGRKDIRLIHLASDKRKDAAARKDALCSADVAILCLPDDAAREAVALVQGAKTRIIDASTAYRTDPEWVYGFAEMTLGQREKIAAARRVSNPGCYACSAVALLRPLTDAGLMSADFPVSINAISGYSGGGRKMIESYEDPKAPDHTESPFRVYALGLEHKHVPEIETHSGLKTRPLFVPSVGRFRQGMIVQVPLHLAALPTRPTPADLHGALANHYEGARFVSVAPLADQPPANIEAETLNGTNDLRLYVFGNAKRGHVVLMAVSDNLGKGASGQAVQNLNVMLGLSEETGL